MDFGFIGCGNMGGALAQAVCKSVSPDQVLLANRTADKAHALASELGCHSAGSDNRQAARSRFIFLCVKPQMMPPVLANIAPILAQNPEGVLITVAAGIRIDQIRHWAGVLASHPVIRMMPNTPVSVGAGMIPYCADGVGPAQTEEFLAALRPAGCLDPIPETWIDAASAVSGCGPAFAYLFIEALADGGVASGLPRKKAQLYAAQMLYGAAKLALDGAQHPGVQKDAVCSPGGSTIQGVRVLEQRAFRGAVMDAVIAAYEKTIELGKNGAKTPDKTKC